MTTYPPDVVPHVPDLERAKRELEAPVRRLFRTWDLLKREPISIHRWAIVELRQRYQLRDQRSERLEVPASASIGKPPPIPEDFSESALAHSWVQRMDAQAHACTGCSFSPGRQTCVACGGGGVLMSRDEHHPCTACGQLGDVTCSLCNGEKLCVWADVSFARDYAESDRRFYKPFEAQFSQAATTLIEHLEGRTTPDALQVSLDARRKGPYRDGPSGESDFHGFRLAGAAEAARREIARRERMRPLLREVRTFAWPVLELRYSILGRGKRLFLISDGAGTPIAFVDR